MRETGMIGTISENAAPNGRNQGQRMNLAVIDDDDDVRSALGRLLRCLGHDVHLFASAEAFEQGPITVDCAIVDVRMPGIGGIKLCQRLRAGATPVPVVLMSGGSKGEVELQSLAKLVPCVAKPFDCDTLIDAIGDAVSSTAAQLESRVD